MEISNRIESHDEETFCRKWWCRFTSCPRKSKDKIVDIAKKAKKLGQDDPRRIIHSLKVGLAITLVSLFYYFDPLYEGFGVSAMWAVLTVVVVFEFSVGATLGKGVNRGIATFVAGALGVGAHRVATFSGEKFEPIILGSCVFTIAAVMTFIRFFPRMKARYDYGLVIFILTFSLISVSGYREDEVLEMAHKRLSTILIGGSCTLFICVFICPIWAGDDLHNQVASNLDKLANFLEGFGDEYFKITTEKCKKNQDLLQEYKSVLNSKSSEEALVNFAKWEPRHGRFRYRHPWDQYLKIGGLTRQCAYKIESLNCYLNADHQTPQETKAKFQESCKKMSKEASQTLKELAKVIKTMSRSTVANSHVKNAKSASDDLKSLLKTGVQDIDLLELIPAATVASILLEIVSCVEKLTEAVHELAPLARFKEVDVGKVSNKVRPQPQIEVPQHAIAME